MGVVYEQLPEHWLPLGTEVHGSSIAATVAGNEFDESTAPYFKPPHVLGIPECRTAEADGNS